MVKVDWVEARIMYITSHTLSYSEIAHYYGVSKATVQSYGTRHNWSADRKDFIDKKNDLILSDRAKELAETEKKHLAFTRYVIDSSTQILNRITHELNTEGLHKDHVTNMSTIIRAAVKAIDMEAAILGLPRHKIKQVITEEYTTAGTQSQYDGTTDLESLIASAKQDLEYLEKRKAKMDRLMSKNS